MSAPRVEWSENDQLVMLQMRLEGQTLWEIAEEFDTTRAEVRRVLKAQGVS